MSTIAIEPVTRQTVCLSSADGRKLLRGIVRNPDQWKGRADDSTGWNLAFIRTIPGDVGEPDSIVTVYTDCNLKPYGERTKTETIDGRSVAVTVPECRYLSFRQYDLPLVCRLLLDSWFLRCRYVFGSLNTHALGIGYFAVTACPDKSNQYQCVTVSETTFQNGRQLTSGAMN